MKKFLVGLAAVAALCIFARPSFDAAKKRADAASHYSDGEIPKVVEVLKNYGRPATLRVIQIGDGGILASGTLENQQGYVMTLEEPIFLFCKTGGLADGDRVTMDVFEIGTMRYKTILGATKTVRTYADSADAAARRMVRAELQLRR